MAGRDSGFRFSLFKAQWSRTATSGASEPSPVQDPPYSKRGQYAKTTLTSTMSLRTSSVKLFAQGSARHLRFLTGSAQRPIPKRAIIHVATLTFGPFEDFTPEFASSLISRAAPSIPRDSDNHQDDRSSAEANPTRTESNMAGRNTQSPTEGDNTLPSIYSGGSWVNVPSGCSPRILLSSTSDITISIEHPSADQSDLLPQPELPPHPADVTTSSINEESFLRMATNDLGW